MSQKKKDPQLAEISEKLDTLIQLTALQLVKEIKVQQKQIALLSDAGFQPSQIASILGTTGGTVNTALNRIRKPKEKKEKVSVPPSQGGAPVPSINQDVEKITPDEKK